MRPIHSVVAASAAVTAAFALGAAAPSSATPTQAESRDTAGSATDTDLRAIGLTGNQRLVRFDVDSPDDLTNIGFVSGLVGDDKLVGIDYRVQNGKLYGVGDEGGIYTLNVRNATGTKVSQLTVALEGRQFGVDFNPAADRLRVISDTGQNLRHDVNPGGVTTVDLTLNYPPDIPVATGVTMAAYTNNDLDTGSATTLFDIDSNLDQVVIQAPANNGSLSATGTIGIDVVAQGGFDIYSFVGESGRTDDLAAYATLRAGDSRYRLYSVELLTGQVRSLGQYRFGTAVVDLALPLNQR